MLHVCNMYATCMLFCHWLSQSQAMVQSQPILRSEIRSNANMSMVNTTNAVVSGNNIQTSSSVLEISLDMNNHASQNNFDQQVTIYKQITATNLKKLDLVKLHNCLHKHKTSNPVNHSTLDSAVGSLNDIIVKA